MSSDQNTAGVPRPVEELSAGEKLERADGPSDQGSELTWPSHQGKWRASISKPARSRRRARAVERDLTNVQFQVGNIYELPFAADSFDGVFAHTVLQHLSDPLRALGEMRRVLRPHGIIGLRDDDLGTLLLEPSTPLLRLWESLHIKVWTHNDGNPFVGRTHRRLLKEAGFMRPQASSSSEYYGSPAGTAGFAAVMVEHHRTPGFVKVVVEQGWADQRLLDSMYTEVLNWGDRDDAFFSYTFCEAIGWKPESSSRSSG